MYLAGCCKTQYFEYEHHIRHSGRREATIRNPGKTIVYWIPDLDFVSSGMTFGPFPGFFGSLLVKFFLKTGGGKKLEYRLLKRG